MKIEVKKMTYDEIKKEKIDICLKYNWIYANMSKEDDQRFKELSQELDKRDEAFHEEWMDLD